MILIENDWLAVAIKPFGAELSRLYHKKTGIEYLWQGDAAFWGKQSPILFPIVGGLKQNRAFHDGQAISLGRHGFAREKMFDCLQHTPSEAHFSLTSSADTRAVYPFDFECRVVYTLENDRLSVQYIVQNPSEQPLLCAIGGHPAFNLPLTADTVYEDYVLHFEVCEPLRRHPLSSDGLLRTTPETVAESAQTLPLSKALFHKDALVFKHLQSKKISIVSEKTPHGLEMTFDGFPYFGIWAAKDAPFVCLEPWCGIADSENSTQIWAEKEGLEHIAPGSTFTRTWSVRLY